MKIIFSTDNGNVHSRSRYLRGGLLGDHHQVKVFRSFETVPEADIWFHGLSHLPGVPINESILNAISRFTGRLAFFQNDDSLWFTLDKIPEKLQKRAIMFLRNVWHADVNLIDPVIRSRVGLINPLLKPNVVKSGMQLSMRQHLISFFGAPTSGLYASRIDALRLLKNEGFPLIGGLFQSPVPDVPGAPEDLLVKQLSVKEHSSLLENTRISLALHGNNPLTYRLFEGFSRRCCVMAQDLSGIRFADCGLKAGIHYVTVKSDLSDLAEKVIYYRDHLDESQAIADAGFSHFKNNFAFSGVNLPRPLYENIIGSWQGIQIKPGRITPGSFIVKMMLPVIHSL